MGRLFVWKCRSERVLRMADPAMKQCECGWKRPLISLTTLEGPMAPANVVPVYNCPCCGMSYVPKEIPEDVARRILRDLFVAPRRAS
jgi:hypothetical protein